MASKESDCKVLLIGGGRGEGEINLLFQKTVAATFWRKRKTSQTLKSKANLFP